MTSAWLLFAARWSGVWPLLSCTFTSASCFTSSLMTFVQLLITAQWRAVQPYTSWLSIGIPVRNISATARASPPAAAARKRRTSAGSTSRKEIQVFTVRKMILARLNSSTCSAQLLIFVQTLMQKEIKSFRVETKFYVVNN